MNADPSNGKQFAVPQVNGAPGETPGGKFERKFPSAPQVGVTIVKSEELLKPKPQASLKCCPICGGDH